MRILIVSQHFWPAIGGAEINLHRLAMQWRRAGHVVVVLTTNLDVGAYWSLLPHEAPPYSIVQLQFWNVRWLGSALYIRDVADWLRKFGGGFDVVYVSMLKHAAFATLLARKCWKTPVILRAEGADSTGDVAWQDSALFGSWIRRRCMTADAVIAPSDAIRKELLTAGFPESKVRLIANGVAIPQQPWQPAETSIWRRQLHLPDYPSIVFTGRLHEGKGIGALIESLPLMQDELAKFQLLLVGDGPDRPRLEQIAIACGVADRVHWIGPTADVEPYLRAAELFVLPSRHEGLSLSLLEAAALGMPAIASDIPPNRNIADESLLPLFEVGSSAAIAAAICKSWRNREQWAERGSELRQQVAGRFSIDQVAQLHLELFHSLARPV